MRLDDFVASRVVEAVVHGPDLTDALGRPPLPMPGATIVTAGILDEPLARRTVDGGPGDLRQDDLGFIRAASGRGEHPDPRFPLIGRGGARQPGKAALKQRRAWNVDTPMQAVMRSGRCRGLAGGRGPPCPGWRR